MRISSSYIIIFFFYLLTSPYFASTLTYIPGMRSIKDVSFSTYTLQESTPQVVEEAITSTNQGRLIENEYKSSYNIDTVEFAYHTDYHGVSTHPTPNPKHPTP